MKYEYKYFTLQTDSFMDKANNETLNENGMKGWRITMASLSPGGGLIFIIMEREIKP